MSKVCPTCDARFEDAVAFCPADGSALRVTGQGDSLVGSVIADRYLVTEPLGEGGMGTVYLGRHLRLPQQVAIKVMRPEMLGDPTAVARFNREAANVARIEHERVVRVYDCGETADGLVYLVMEFVAGRTLKALLEAEGPLALPRAARLVRQVAEGLEAAHRLGIVHRDLKPDNIVVMTGPDGERCKVLDFGIAKPVDGAAAGEGRGLTRTGFILGTPEYMSPEQVLGADLDARSDVYALALVAFQCITGTLPFDTTTPDRGLMARLMSAPRPMAAVREATGWSPATEEAVQGALDAALAREPAARTASVLAFAGALEAAVLPADAVPRPVAEPAVPGAPPALALAATVVPAPAPPADPAVASPDGAPYAAPPTGAAAAPVSAPAATGTGRRAAPVPAPPASSRRWLVAVVAGVVAVGGGGGWLALQRGSTAASGVASDAVDAVVAPPGATPATTPATVPAPAPDTAADRVAGPSAAPSDRPSTAPPAPATPSTTGAPSLPPRGGRVPIAEPGGPPARERLDRLSRQLDPATTDAETARRLVPALQAVLREQVTGDDSTWALVRIGEAYLLAGEEPPACAALARARRRARTANQLEAIRSLLSATAGCAP